MPLNGYVSPSGGTPAAGNAADGQQRSYVADPFEVHGWLHTLAWRGGRTEDGDATAELATWAVNTSGNPSDDMVKTDEFAVTALMTGGSGTPDIGSITAHVLESPIICRQGSQRAYGVVPDDNDIRFGMIAAADLPAESNRLFYDRTGVSGPTDPNGYTSSSPQGHMAIWGIFETNVGPDKPALVTVDGLESTVVGSPVVIASFTPTIRGQFRDDNEEVGPFVVGEADTMKRFRYRIRNVTSGGVVWDSGILNSFSSERTTRLFARVYPGSPALTSGPLYAVEAMVYDQLDTSSEWSDRRYFTIAAGSMDTPTTPTLKQNTRTPSPFATVWHHSSALSTNAVQILIEDRATGQVIRNSGTLAKTVADGAASSVTFSDAFSTNALDWGTDATWRMRGRASDGNWGSYSAKQPFTVNAAPSVPALLNPTNEQVVTDYPALRAQITDVDDTTVSGLLVIFEIFDVDGDLLQTRDGTHTTNGIFEYQTDVTDLADFGVFRYRAYGFDGTTYSGGTDVEADAQRSGMRTFTYADGPVPTITAPTDASTITTDEPTIEWTVDGTQEKRRVIVTRVADGAIMHDTGDVITASLSYVLPASLSGGEPLHQDDVITIDVYVTDDLDLVGSDSVTVTLTYDRPDTLPLSVNEENAPGDITPSKVVARWPQTSEDMDEWRYYQLTRKPTSEAISRDPTLDPRTVWFPRIRSATQVQYDDYTAKPNTEYLYTLYQYIEPGVDLIRSLPATAIITIRFDATIIHSVRDTSKRVVLPARQVREITPVSDIVLLKPWNQRGGVHLHGETSYREVECEYTIIAETMYDANNTINVVMAMAEEGGPLHYRDGRGNSIFGEFSEKPKLIDPQGGRPLKLRVKFRELEYDESITSIEEV